MFSPQQLPYICVGMLLMTLQPVLVTLSQNAEGRFDYNLVSATLFSEALKIVISGGLLATSEQRGSVRFDCKEALKFATPAAIYCVNNNLIFIILRHVNATTFQLLSQLKIVFTGLLFRVFLSRELTVWQYLSIWQLALGTATCHIPQCQTSHDESAADTSAVGLTLSVLSCLLSSFGGIYSEKLLKDCAHLARARSPGIDAMRAM